MSVAQISMSQPLKCRETKMVDPPNVFTVWFPLGTGTPTFHTIRSLKTVREELAWAGCLGSVPVFPEERKQRCVPRKEHMWRFTGEGASSLLSGVLLSGVLLSGVRNVCQACSG